MSCAPEGNVPSQVAPVVYLVDDDPSVLRALSRRLRAAHLDVQTFDSAEAFLNRSFSSAPCCAVVDLEMPGYGGLRLQAALAEEEEPVPVVFLTAHGDVSFSVNAMKGGAIDFLTKPVRGEELLVAVQRALARGGAERQTRAHQRAWRDRYAVLTPAEPGFSRRSCAGFPMKESPMRLPLRSGPLRRIALR